MAAALFACYMDFLFLFFFDGIVLQSIVSFFTGADLHRIVNGGDKDLAIAILAGVESLLRHLDDGAGRDLGYHDVDADLWQKLCRDGSAAVHLRLSFFETVAQCFRDGHARDADGFHGSLQDLEAFIRSNDRDAVEAVSIGRQFFRHDLFCFCFLFFCKRYFDGIFRCLACFQCFGCGVRRHHEVCIRRDETVFFEVKAIDLFFTGDAKTIRGFDDAEYNVYRNEYVEGYNDNAEDLDHEEMRISCVEKAVFDREDAGQDGAECAAHAVSGDGADWIIDLHLLIDEFDCIDDRDAGDDADPEGTGHGNDIRACGDGYETGKTAVQCHRNIRFAIFHPGEKHGGDSAGSGCHIRGNHDAADGEDRIIAGHGNGGAAIESEPAHPQDEHAKAGKSDGVTGDRIDAAILVVLANSWPKQRCTDQSADAADHVYTGGSGEVMEAELGEPAAAPDPVSGDRIDQERDHNGIDAVGGEFRTFCHRAGDDRRRGRTEDGLEEEVDQRRIACIAGVIVSDEEIRRADDAADVFTEHEAEAQDPENDGAKCKVHEILHDDVACILCSREPSLHHRKSRLHEEYQDSPQQCPGRIRRGVLSLRIRRHDHGRRAQGRRQKRPFG